MAFADWFARWGFALLTVFFLLLVGAALFLLPRIRTSAPGPIPTRPAQTSAEQAPVTDPIYLSVASVPAGARVDIDVDSVGVTPLFLYPVERSVHLLSVAMQGFRRIDTMLYDKSIDTAAFVFVLSPIGDVSLPPSTEPAEQLPDPNAGASRRAESQTNPSNDRTRPAADDTRTVQQPTSEQRRAELEPAPPRQQDPPVQPATGQLTISSEPLGATVIVDGTEIGSTPTSLAEVLPGQHEVIVRLFGYDDFARTVDVTAGQSTVVSATLVQAMGELAVLVRPWGSIHVDGRLMKRDIDIEHRMSLPAGEHTVAASHPSLGRITRTVRIRPGQLHRIVFDLNEMNVHESQ